MSETYPSPEALQSAMKALEQGITSTVAEYGERFRALKELFLQDFSHNPRYDAFKASLHPISAEQFPKDMARQAMEWLDAEWRHKEGEDSRSLRFLEVAKAQLWRIQHKKLFDLQCRWRAGQVEIPGLDICYEFKIWAGKIHLCPFLDPITEEELQLFIDFTLSGYHRDPGEARDWYVDDWQDYHELKKGVQDPESGILPNEWYQFYDLKMGTGNLLALPDLKGAKEKHYQDLAIREQRGNTVNEAPDPRPHFYYFRESDLELFFSEVGSPRLRKAHEEYNKHQARKSERELIMELVEELLDCESTYPIEAHTDWRQALEKAVWQMQCHQLARALPQAFQEYQMRQQFGLAHKEPNPKHENGFDDIIAHRKKLILRGRELSGEPRDFSY